MSAEIHMSTRKDLQIFRNMKRWVRLVLFVVCAAASVCYSASPQIMAQDASPTFKLAVMDFRDNSIMNPDDMTPLQSGLADMVITTFDRLSMVQVVERRALNKILEEIALGQTGVVKSGDEVEAGRVLGAHYLVLGSFMVDSKKRIRIDCRIVKTETGEMVKSVRVEGKLKDVLDLADDLNRKILKDLDVKLTDVDRKRLEDEWPSCDYEVIMQYFQALTLSDREKHDEAVSMLEKVLKECPDFTQAQDLKARLEGSDE